MLGIEIKFTITNKGAVTTLTAFLLLLLLKKQPESSLDAVVKIGSWRHRNCPNNPYLWYNGIVSRISARNINNLVSAAVS